MSDQQLPQTPHQRIKELEVQLRDANEKACLFEAELVNPLLALMECSSSLRP